MGLVSRITGETRAGSTLGDTFVWGCILILGQGDVEQLSVILFRHVSALGVCVLLLSLSALQ